MASVKYQPVNVKSFLTKYKKDMSCEDIQFFKQFDKFQADFKNSVQCESRYGTHYSVCVWNSDDENISGPDTCLCHYVVVKKQKVLFLMRLYTDAVKGREKKSHHSRCSIC